MCRLVLFMFVFPATYALAYVSTDKNLASYYKASSIIQAVVEQADSIEFFDGEKLYLKPGNIFNVNSGYILYNGKSTIFLPRLFSDQKGYYLCKRSQDDFKLTCSNSKCRYIWWFSDNWSIYCPQCGEMGN